MRIHKIDLPVVVLTAYGDEKIASSCIQAGAHEYLPKGGLGIKDLSQGICKALKSHRRQKEIRQSISKMAELSSRDELTGLYNRRNMYGILEQETHRATGCASDISILLFDLDHFKQINDIFGHACGDFVLQAFSKRLKANIRKSDFAFRYGGEEFMVLLPHTGRAEAMQMAEKLRALVQSEELVFGEHRLHVTTSIGIAALKDCKPPLPRDLIAFADKALYLAKAEGRNCVRIYQQENAEEFVSAEQVLGGKGFRYLKEQLSAILEKTKKHSMNSLELLIKELGGKKMEAETRLLIQYITLVCHELRLSAPVTNAVIQAASLHGCFKILLGEKLINKKEPLTPEEKALIERHPYMLIELTQLFDFLSSERSVLLYHHENYDGSGYPGGLTSDEIPLGARIFAIADALVAMSAERPYRGKISPEKTISELVGNAGSQFDPVLVGLFLDVIAANHLLDVPEEMLAESRAKLRQRMSERK